MNNVLGVEVVNGGQDSKQQLLRQVFRVNTLLHDAVEQVTAAHEVHHKVYSLLSLHKKKKKKAVAQNTHAHDARGKSERKASVTRGESFDESEKKKKKVRYSYDKTYYIYE